MVSVPAVTSPGAKPARRALPHPSASGRAGIRRRLRRNAGPGCRGTGFFLVTLLGLIALLGLPGTTRAEAPADLGLHGGVAWALPTGGAIGEAYDGGPLVRVGVALRGRSRIQGLLSAGFHQETSRPSHPVFAQNVDARIRWIPVTLEGRYFLLPGSRSPWVSLGIGLWSLSETFGYRLAGEDLEAKGNRTTLAGVLGFGMELSDTPFPIRLGGRFEFSSIGRRTLTSDGPGFDAEGSEVSTYFSIGIEVES